MDSMRAASMVSADKNEVHFLVRILVCGPCTVERQY